MQGGIDHYIVELDNIYEQGMNVKSTGLLGHVETVLEDEDLAALYNPDRYRKTNGKLLAVPKSMSGTILETKHPGFPVPKRYFSSEMVAQNLHFAAARGIGPRDMYCPSTHEPEYVTMRDRFSPSFSVGMALHFFWTATKEPESCIGSEKQYGQTDANGSLKVRHTFKISARSVVCADDGTDVFMNDGMCLVEKIMQTEADIMTKSGIFTQSEITAIGEVGIIRHSSSMPTGNKIRFIPNADYEIEVLGKRYYAMEESCVVASVDGNGNVLPNGARLVILPEKEEEKTHNGTIIPETARKTPPRGTIISVGPRCESLAVGEKVMFGSIISHYEQEGDVFFIVEEHDVFAKIIQ